MVVWKNAFKKNIRWKINQRATLNKKNDILA
jgi:hypothetical protein